MILEALFFTSIARSLRALTESDTSSLILSSLLQLINLDDLEGAGFFDSLHTGLSALFGKIRRKERFGLRPVMTLIFMRGIPSGSRAS